jgi:hypothetical protein
MATREGGVGHQKHENTPPQAEVDSTVQSLPPSADLPACPPKEEGRKAYSLGSSKNTLGLKNLSDKLAPK